MQDIDKTKKQLIDELKNLRQRVHDLEDLQAQRSFSEAALNESEERYRTILEASPVSITAIRNGRILFTNPAGSRMLGFTDPAEMIDIPVLDIVSPASLTTVRKRIERLESGKDNPLAEIELIRQDGTKITVESTSISIPIDGIPTAVIIAHDISVRKEKAEKLQMMQFSMDRALDRIAWIAPDGRFLYANEAACKEMDYSLDEVLSMSVSDIDPDFPEERWPEHFQEVKKRGSMRLEIQQISGDGQTHNIEVAINYLQFGDREFICSFGRDITELKMTQEALTEQLEFERLISDISARLAQVHPAQLDTEINQTLQSLGRFLGAERAFLFQFSEDAKNLKNPVVWAAEGFSPLSEIFELDLASDIPWVARKIRSGEVIMVGPGYTGLPAEAHQLRRQLERDGIKSGVVVPVFVEGRAIGMLGLDTIDEAREYPAPLVERLRILADIIGSTLQRIGAQGILERYRHIVESTTSIVGLVDRNYVYQYVNDAYCAAFQKERQQIIGYTVTDFFPPEMFEQTIKPHYDRCFTGEEVTFQAWAEFAGWGNRFMDVRYSPFFDSDGKVSAVVVSAHDITGIKLLELKLAESEERFRAFMENIPATVYIKDEEDRHIYANPEGYKEIGKKPDEFIGLTTRDLWSPQLAEKLIALDKKVIDEDIARIVEEWQNTERGDTVWRRDIKFPIRLESGKKLLGGIALDITDIKLNEQKLREAYREIQQLQQKLEQENIYLREEIELQHQHHEIIGQSNAIRQMLSQAEQVAHTDSTVLILGETGTGKELLARAIHRMSPRHHHPMITVNCAALPESLIESEMFGREKGAFTGALSGRIGRFEVADGSTIFLDEIGELIPDVQIKLLRVLEKGHFERLGSNKTIKVDVRIITATNRDLVKAVHEGRFRRDLYYRLNVFPIRVPSLQDRLEDLELLIWAFVKEFGDHMGKRIETIPRKSLEALKRCPWRGNIRELRNVIEQSMIITKGKTLDVQLPGAQDQGNNQTVLLQDVERNHILKILKQTGWRVRGKDGAAEILGLRESTLRFRMKKLGIQRPGRNRGVK
jgi:PAS domain S-box-containing protein